MKTTIVASSEFIIKTQMINFYAALEHNHCYCNSIPILCKYEDTGVLARTCMCMIPDFLYKKNDNFCFSCIITYTLIFSKFKNISATQNIAVIEVYRPDKNYLIFSLSNK